MDRYEYDDNQPPRRLVIGAAALAAVLLLLLGTAIGRASAPAAGPTSSAISATPTPAGPGPTHVVNGVPVGYAHTEAGAVAAATNFLMVVDGPLITQPDRYRSAIDTLSAPEARAKQRQNAEKDMDALQGAASLLTYAEQGRQVVFRVVPLAYHLDRYSDGGSRVSIWAEGLSAVDGVLSIRETWTTSSVTVRWIGDDWRLLGIDPPSASSEGPVPLTDQPPLLSPNLPAQLKSYRSYEHGVVP
ncbi:MAG TPA: hypothetical protein VOB72_14970 [Candidatus Dormibacteraeota bacterium]|nr:hypothetical protein [Candidatus Dormibacteraeota bacterium]